MNSCPICGSNNLYEESYSDYDMGISCVEEHIRCNICNYRYDYEYGQYFECFGRYEFAWNYLTKTNKNYYMKLMKDLKHKKFIAHKKWKKNLRKEFKR